MPKSVGGLRQQAHGGSCQRLTRRRRCNFVARMARLRLRLLRIHVVRRGSGGALLIAGSVLLPLTFSTFTIASLEILRRRFT